MNRDVSESGVSNVGEKPQRLGTSAPASLQSTAGSPQATYDRKSEVEALLEEDDTRVGETFRWAREGLTIQQQTERAGVAGKYNYASIIKSLTDGFVPEGPTLALASARKIRAWLKEKEISFDLRRDLELTESQLMLKAESLDAQGDEERKASDITKQVAAAGVPGIYVYTLPHYWRYKVDPERDMTYLKVGRSEADVFLRVGHQTTTAVPEDPWLLRVYPTSNSAQMERKFHAMLEAADHTRSTAKRGGREWFLTSLRILDWYAADQGLDIQRPTEQTVGDE